MFETLYPQEQHAAQRDRYARIAALFDHHFPGGGSVFFSVPGRTEIGGNHTDHNQGRVLAASINLDAIAVAAPSGDMQVTLYSEGYQEPSLVGLEDLRVLEEEKGTTAALIRGIAARFKALGYRIEGFNACVTSDVLTGSGLSSSAAIEVLIGAIFNRLFNQNALPATQIAEIGQFAENVYFGKPCGLMDQTACAVGGIITIDFADPEAAEIRKVHFDFAAQDYRLLVVNTGGNHADLTPDYAAVPAEMKAVARELGQPHLRKVTLESFLPQIPALREKTGDRAVLRALHFLEENERVVSQVAALESGHFPEFLRLVSASGKSSFQWLQNIYTPQNIREQGVTLALALSDLYISRLGEGACRVHGGGFAGTIQAFLPTRAVPAYVGLMEPVFGKGAVNVLHIRDQGIVCGTGEV
ncbi:MAG: hypothetical protein KBC60_07115 [Haliscomenobacter sp.]|nr:hypothetical protein [Haliscomenobacter sp.]